MSRMCLFLSWMLGIRTMRWRNLQRPSMKCWSLQNVLSTSTLSLSAGCHLTNNGSEGSIQLGQRMLRCNDDSIWTFSTQRPCTTANMYQSDKILHALKMTYEKIHACEKGCALFRLDYADLNYCPICKCSRYIVVDNGMGEKT